MTCLPSFRPCLVACQAKRNACCLQRFGLRRNAPTHCRNQLAMQNLIDFLGKEKAFTLIPISREIAIYAGILRGQTGMKTPDAMHVASAIYAECDIFLSNDNGIKTSPKLEKVIFSDSGNSSI